MRSRVPVSLLVAVLLLAACQTQQKTPPDPNSLLLQRNPALAAYQERDPGRAEAVLSDIRAMRQRRVDPSIRLPQKDREIVLPGDTEAEARKRKRDDLVELLQTNPALKAIYKRDRKATLKLIRLIQE